MASRHDGRQTIKPPPVAEMIKAAVTNTPGLAKYIRNEAQLEELAGKLQSELARETTTRQADMCALRELVDGESVARDSHHSSLLELITGEKAARVRLEARLQEQHDLEHAARATQL